MAMSQLGVQMGLASTRGSVMTTTSLVLHKSEQSEDGVQKSLHFITCKYVRRGENRV